MADRPHRVHSSTVGTPIPHQWGQFAGSTVRTDILEIQKADLGRKYAKVDRRPLDPPPVVWLRFFIVRDDGTDAQREEEVQDYSQIANIGLLCAVDLFPVPGSDNPDTTSPWLSPSAPSDPASPVSPQSPPTSSSSSSFSYRRPSSPSPPPSATSVPFRTHRTHPYPQQPPQPHHHNHNHNHREQTRPGGAAAPSAAHVIAHFRGHAITEESKCTAALVGAAVAECVDIDYAGRPALVFVFPDLAVKTEGTFILRYRVFDIFSRPSAEGVFPVQAECFGGPFRVYSTKEFPGLHASTELTKRLARWGVRLNYRESERRGRAAGAGAGGSGGSPEPPARSAHGGGAVRRR